MFRNYRFDTEGTGGTGYNPPSTSLTWKTSPGQDISSSSTACTPLVSSDGSVYIYNTGRDRVEVYSSDGKLKWIVTDSDFFGELYTNIALDAKDNLYVNFYGAIAKYDTNGNRLWRTTLDYYNGQYPHTVGAPVPSNDGTMVFVLTSGYDATSTTLAISPKIIALGIDGTVKWKYELLANMANYGGLTHVKSIAKRWITPAVDANDNIYVVVDGMDIAVTGTLADSDLPQSYFGTIYKIDKNGNRVWHCSLKDGPRGNYTYNQSYPPCNLWTSPTVGPDGTVYAFETKWNELYAISSNGNISWVKDIGHATGTRINQNGVAISSNGDVIAVCNDGGNKPTQIKVLDLNPKDGSQNWLIGPGFMNGVAQYSYPTIDIDGNIYIASDVGTVYKLNSQGMIVWHYTDSGTVANAILTPTSITRDGRLFFADDYGSLYAFGFYTVPVSGVDSGTGNNNNGGSTNTNTGGSNGTGSTVTNNQDNTDTAPDTFFFNFNSIGLTSPIENKYYQKFDPILNQMYTVCEYCQHIIENMSTYSIPVDFVNNGWQFIQNYSLKGLFDITNVGIFLDKLDIDEVKSSFWCPHCGSLVFTRLFSILSDSSPTIDTVITFFGGESNISSVTIAYPDSYSLSFKNLQSIGSLVALSSGNVISYNLKYYNSSQASLTTMINGVNTIVGSVGIKRSSIDGINYNRYLTITFSPPAYGFFVDNITYYLSINKTLFDMTSVARLSHYDLTSANVIFNNNDTKTYNGCIIRKS